MSKLRENFLENYEAPEVLVERFNPVQALRQLTNAGNPVNRLVAMIGAYNFVKGSNFVSFKFKGYRKYNYCKITLNSNDTYTLRISKIAKVREVNVKEFKNIYFDQLKELFEETTLLQLSL